MPKTKKIKQKSTKHYEFMRKMTKKWVLRVKIYAFAPNTPSLKINFRELIKGAEISAKGKGKFEIYQTQNTPPLTRNSPQMT